MPDKSFIIKRNFQKGDYIDRFVFTMKNDAEIKEYCRRKRITANKLTLEDLIGDDMNTDNKKPEKINFQDHDYFDVSALSDEGKFEFAKKLNEVSSVTAFVNANIAKEDFRECNYLVFDYAAKQFDRASIAYNWFSASLPLELIGSAYSEQSAKAPGQLEPSLKELLEQVQSRLPDSMQIHMSNQHIKVQPAPQDKCISLDMAILLAKTFGA